MRIDFTVEKQWSSDEDLILINFYKEFKEIKAFGKDIEFHFHQLFLKRNFYEKTPEDVSPSLMHLS